MALTLLLAATASRGTSGCGKSPDGNPGSTVNRYITVDGDSRLYRLRIPSGYDRNKPTPIFLSFHGWGSTAQYEEGYMGFNNVARDKDVIAVYPEGMSDYQRSSNNGWQSWNGGGSTGTKGTECRSSTTGYCYQSCQSRKGGCNRCEWTTCKDDNKFVSMLLDKLEDELCLDQDRYYATGYSNGGTYTYEAGKSLTSRFAAIVPGGGTPFVGHNEAPDTRDSYISVLDLHGTRDTTCPANSTYSSEGWAYLPVDDVLKVWAAANGCTKTNELTRFPTDWDGTTQLYCVSIGECPAGVDVVRCSYNLGHHWLDYNKNGGAGASLAIDFMLKHPRVAKALHGNRTAVTL